MSSAFVALMRSVDGLRQSLDFNTQSIIKQRTSLLGLKKPVPMALMSTLTMLVAKLVIK